MTDEIEMFDPDMLSTLIAVAETRSFTEAGRLLGRSQSTISASILRLEKVAGCKLVHRTTRSVLLTNAGEEMVRHARLVGELSLQAKRRLKQPQGAGPVRLGVFMSFSSDAMPKALREFSRLHEGVQVKIETDRSDILLSRLRDDALDIVLATRQQGHGFGPPLFQDELVWVGTREIPTKRHEPIPLAVRVRPSMLRRVGIEALNVAGRHHMIAFEGNSLPSVAAAVEGGLGISVFSRTVRPLRIPVLDRPHLLPRLGCIDFVLLKSETSERKEVDTLHTILRDMSSELFRTMASSIFGGVGTDVDGPQDEIAVG